MKILTINYGGEKRGEDRKETLKDVTAWNFFGSEMIIDMLNNNCEVRHLHEINSYSWVEQTNRAQRRKK